MSVNAILRIVKGPREGEEIKLANGEQITIGRKAENDLTLSDGHMSRRHFALEVTETEVILTDLNSSHGTTVGGNRVTEATVLKSGDEISAGVTKFTIEVMSEADARPRAKATSETVASEPEHRQGSSEPSSAPAPAAEAPDAGSAEASPQDDSWGDPSAPIGDVEAIGSSTRNQGADAAAPREPPTEELPKQPSKTESQGWDEMWSSHPSGSSSKNESAPEDGPSDEPAPAPPAKEPANDPEPEAGAGSTSEPNSDPNDDDWW